MIVEAAAAVGLFILARRSQGPGAVSPIDPTTGQPIGYSAAQGIKPGGYTASEGAIAGGAAAGAAQGAAFGPIGVGVGTVAGAILGYGLNDRARSSAASKGWAAVQQGINDYAAALRAQGVTDTDTINYLVGDWAADFGIRGRNGMFPWPGKVPVQQSGIHAAESLRDNAKASLLARGVGVPPSMRIDGSVIPGIPANPAPVLIKSPSTVSVTPPASARPSY
jgi:hypothetical protein